MLQVVTDSSCDLPEELIKENNIRVVPLTIHIEDQLYREGVDISTEEFYDKMAKSPSLPKTSQPQPAAFAGVFRELADFGEVLCLTISSKLSGTFQSACLGRELSGVDAFVFDTLAGSLGHGLQVLKACQLAQAGCTAKEIMGELTQYRDKMKILILLKTLENIVKGGRLSRFQGSLASILNIRLLLHNVEGRVELLEKVRGSRRLFARVLELIRGYCPDMTGRDVGITHFRNQADTEKIKEALQEQFHPRRIIINKMGATMATYAGEGGMIISF
ncbi:MAG: DegV family protein [bacterium]|nr:DegV family protein [Bacillota bacterium]HHW54587.1 DegV family protein [Bacillota bacterium]